jgi:hypothetical protein
MWKILDPFAPDRDSSAFESQWVAGRHGIAATLGRVRRNRTYVYLGLTRAAGKIQC